MSPADTITAQAPAAAPAAPKSAKQKVLVLEVKPGRHLLCPDLRTHRGGPGYRVLADDPFIPEQRHQLREAEDQKAAPAPLSDLPVYWRNEAKRLGYTQSR